MKPNRAADLVGAFGALGASILFLLAADAAFFDLPEEGGAFGLGSLCLLFSLAFGAIFASRMTRK